MRLIKRYQNKKLYDIENSCYITLSEMLEICLDDEFAIVLDVKTEKDITDYMISHATYHLYKDNAHFQGRIWEYANTYFKFDKSKVEVTDE